MWRARLRLSDWSAFRSGAEHEHAVHLCHKRATYRHTRTQVTQPPTLKKTKTKRASRSLNTSFISTRLLILIFVKQRKGSVPMSRWAQSASVAPGANYGAEEVVGRGESRRPNTIRPVPSLPLTFSLPLGLELELLVGAASSSVSNARCKSRCHATAMWSLWEWISIPSQKYTRGDQLLEPERPQILLCWK